MDDSHRNEWQRKAPELVVVELGEEEILILVSCRMWSKVPVTEEVEHRGDQLRVAHVCEDGSALSPGTAGSGD